VGEASDCGGFSMEDEETSDSDDYCEAERLSWEYDAESGRLALTDERVLLNCCGIHDISLSLEDGVYVITETDTPEGDMGRCDCMCVFDFALTATDVPAEVVPVRLMRRVTDSSDEPLTIWEGSLDLSLGSGSFELDTTDVGMWCGE